MAEKKLGVFTQEEWKDTMIYAVIAAVITFLATIFYRWLGKYLETH